MPFPSEETVSAATADTAEATALAATEAGSALEFPLNDGEMAHLIRQHDWAATPLGHPSQWSASLRMVVRFMLANRFPHLLWWGPDYIQIYNDHYIPILGTKHPQQALGRPFRECWHEVYHILGPLVDTPFNGGPATWMEDIELIVRRHDFPEESHFIFAYSPVPDDTAPRGIGGVLATVNEITEKVVTERRVKILSELGARVAAAKTDKQACVQAIDILAQHPKDVPFALLYLLDETDHELRLVSTTGIPAESVGPAAISLRTPMTEVSWPLAEALHTEAIQLREGLSSLLPTVPPGPWPDPPNAVAVVPIKSQFAGRPAGALVVGISACLRPDARYLSFLELLGSQVATAIGNARAYQQERRRAEALAEIDRAKTVFFSNISHEFRTPLTLMLGPLDDALSTPKTPAAVRSHVKVAQRNAQRLLKLVNSLLDFARIEAGRMQASFAPLDLAALTTDLASTFRSAMQRAKLDFEVTCEPVGEPVCLDRDMWEKIVLNLLSNALKFTMEGYVRVRTYREGEQAVLEVSDSGVGVADHELPRLFERFHRVHGTEARTHEGSGIGLSLVQELVKLNGGAIEVTSKLGTGTRFRVRLPLGTAHIPAERIAAARSAAATVTNAQIYVQEALGTLPEDGDKAPVVGATDSHAAKHDTRFASTFGARVLLADDNADMRNYARELLGSRYQVETAADGAQALEAARRARPDLIIADVMMPKLDGFELVKALRADLNLSEIPIILLSARAGEEARIGGLGAGADDYVVKPFHARELLARVGATLELTALRRENEERLRAYISASSDVVYRMSADWSEMRLLKGHNFIADQTDSSHTWINKYIPEGDRPSVMAAIQEAIGTKSVFELEHRVIRADGSAGWTFSRAIPLLDDEGNILEWFGAASDVTERRETHEALEGQRRQLEVADRQKNEFLAMLAHELRNPLAPIRNASELLTRIVSGNAQAQRVVNIVQRQVSHMSHLVDDLLDVSRITQRKIDLRKETVEVAEIIRQAVETVEPIIRERGHDLQIHSSYRNLHVHGDVSRLVQCVVNLLTNAAKYTEKGGHINITSREHSQAAVIEVADNGMGIAPDLLPSVFDLFVQSVRTLDRAQGGLGIGLSVVQRLIEMHGGTVSAESAGAGRGATFSIRLPLAAPPVSRGDDSKAVSVKPRRVLVVDDNADAADTLSMMLNLDGHETATAYTAPDALAQADSFRPDAILLDIGLPGADGYEVARRIREMPSGASIRLVALSGYGQPEDRARTQRDGFDAHLVKPVTPENIRRVLADGVERS